jgi:hypothetical protein
MRRRSEATNAVDCHACGWTGIVHLYRTPTTELWVCPACIHAHEATLSELLAHG